MLHPEPAYRARLDPIRKPLPLVSPLDGPDLELVKYREPGIATLAIGTAAAVTGAALLGLALRQRSRSSLAATPTFGPQFTGISLGGSF